MLIIEQNLRFWVWAHVTHQAQYVRSRSPAERSGSDWIHSDRRGQFDKEDAPASKNEDDKDRSGDKLEKLEKMPRKMLSRGVRLWLAILLRDAMSFILEIAKERQGDK